MSVQHTLSAERRTLHGHFSADLPPVLTIDSGDSVRFQCLDAYWSLEPYTELHKPYRQIEPRDPALDSGHCLTGPVALRGAKPGMTLAVQINALELGGWGWSMAGGFANDWNDQLGIGKGTPGIMQTWTFDYAAGTARNQHGHTVKTRPFMGVMGMPPAERGVHPTAPPRRTGGNMDCKELVAGSTLYLPIEVEGGLFSVGDGHAVQGDGEISVTAIEAPMDRVDLTFTLLDDMPLTTPVAYTHAGWIALGFHANLNEAAAQAVDSMLTLMKRLHGLERLEALSLASLTVDLRVTQVVNGVRGVHALLPDGAFQL